jgi:hypothetical protein
VAARQTPAGPSPPPPPPPCAGLLYTSAPRGEVTGTAEFVDAQNGLQAVVRFGRVEEAGAAHSPLLQRPDALSGSIHRLAPASPTGIVRQDSAGSSGSWQSPTAAQERVRAGRG